MLPPGTKKLRNGMTGKNAKVATEKSLEEKAGRPPCQIDEVQVFEMASYDCTVEEIAAHFKCSVSTLYERFSETLRIGKLAGKQKLRQNMERKACEGGPGDTSLLIWLSKQRLGYRERAADEVQQVVFNLNIKEIP
jgi:AraC-like DNA-binding protein